MRRTKPFPCFPHDRMLNETLHVTCAVCYHSACLSLQTGHYPAIILPDLQSPAEDTIAVSCSPLGGEWIEPSLKICIYTIRLSGLLDLDIYFPLKAMFDYTLIKDRKNH